MTHTRGSGYEHIINAESYDVTRDSDLILVFAHVVKKEGNVIRSIEAGK